VTALHWRQEIIIQRELISLARLGRCERVDTLHDRHHHDIVAHGGDREVGFCCRSRFKSEVLERVGEVFVSEMKFAPVEGARTLESSPRMPCVQEALRRL
jgi:hypothetical protein